MRGRMSTCVAIGRCPPLTMEALVRRVKRLSHAWSADFSHCSSLMQFLGLAQLTAGEASSSKTMYLGGLNWCWGVMFLQVDSFHALRRSDPPFVSPSSLLQQGLSPFVRPYYLWGFSFVIMFLSLVTWAPCWHSLSLLLSFAGDISCYAFQWCQDSEFGHSRYSFAIHFCVGAVQGSCCCFWAQPSCLCGYDGFSFSFIWQSVLDTHLQHSVTSL